MRWTAALLALIAIFSSGSLANDAPPQRYHVYIGTYTSADGSQGIYTFDFDARTGQAGDARLAATMTNPTFLALHPSGKFLYAAGEVAQQQGKPGGAVAAFAIDANGQLTPINVESSGGAGACHLVVDPSGRNVLVANYGGGSIACLPLESDGSVKPATAFIQHHGPSRADPRRQDAPHAHSINVAPGGQIALAADLGTDKIHIYAFDPDHGTLTPHRVPYASVPAGGGPRHFAFHPAGRFAYANNEMSSAVTVFRWDDQRQVLTPVQTISTLPAPTPGNTTAEVAVHPGGKFLYVSNRGHDSLAIFAINPADGTLQPAGHAPTGGKVPRNFAITPCGRWLLAANQESATINIFSINDATGALSPAGEPVNVSKPVCVRFLPY